MHTVTNHVPRDVIEAYELTESEQQLFDYIDWGKVKAGEASHSFFRYKGELFDIGEFERAPAFSDLSGKWDGYQSDTFFSATVVKYVNDFEQVIVGRVYT
jgi:hypothetical protein